MSSKKAKLLEESLTADLHPFAARRMPPTPPSEIQYEPAQDQNPATPQTGNPTNGVAVNPASRDAGKRESGGAGKPSSGEAGNTVAQHEQGTAITTRPKDQIIKWTVYARPKTKKAIQRIAFEEDSNDYDIVQQALDEYLAKRGVKQ
jgi:hypothetical protein